MQLTEATIKASCRSNKERVAESRSLSSSTRTLFERHDALIRSEEHTSELQSLRHLVCRLLLEKETDGSSGQPLDQAEPRGVRSEPTAWLFGNEAWGMPADILALPDETVAVPGYGRAESLDLAAAAAVGLYASAGAQRANEGWGCRTAAATR